MRRKLNSGESDYGWQKGKRGRGGAITYLFIKEPGKYALRRLIKNEEMHVNHFVFMFQRKHDLIWMVG